MAKNPFREVEKALSGTTSTTRSTAKKPVKKASGTSRQAAIEAAERKRKQSRYTRSSTAKGRKR